MVNGDSEINFHVYENNFNMFRSNRYLGVQIHSELKWRKHITFAIGKISRALGMPKDAKKYLLLDTVKIHAHKYI